MSARIGVITLDGSAGSGKSTVARMLSERLGIPHLDTGAMYRAVTWAALREGIPFEHSRRVAALVKRLCFRMGPDGLDIRLGRRRPGGELRAPEVSRAIHGVSHNRAVRRALIRIQRAAARSVSGLVADGRDMGSVVFPDARWKFFLDADASVRARRIRRDLARKGILRPLSEVLRDLKRRDAGDRSAVVTPTVVPPGAIRIRTSLLTPAETLRRILRRILPRR
ncbi:MAG: (d)CMP kinase [Planctomycetota bacterium]